jgi:hypothetical protein
LLKKLLGAIPNHGIELLLGSKLMTHCATFGGTMKLHLRSSKLLQDASCSDAMKLYQFLSNKFLLFPEAGAFDATHNKMQHVKTTDWQI